MSTATLDAPPVAVEPLSDYEKERGKPRPSKNHGLIQMRLGIALSRSEKYEPASETTLNIETPTPLTPDISIMERRPIDLWNDEIRVTQPPVTTVEIMSATQSSAEMMKKVHSYLAHGVQTCWLVDPPLHQITIFSADGGRKSWDHGIVTDPVTGLTADLAAVFA